MVRAYPAKIIHYVFGYFEDIEQQVWQAILSDKDLIRLTNEPIDGNEGMIVTIAYRRMIDHIRSTIGRKTDGTTHPKVKGVLRTQDLYTQADPESGDLEIQIPCSRHTPATVDDHVLASEVEAFMRSKLSRREKMIMDYLYQKDMGGREVGKKFSLTKGRISQVRKQAISKLQEFLNDDP